MQFKPTKLFEFYKRHEALGLTAIHQSNPQPLTLGELETLIDEPLLELAQSTPLGYAAVAGDESLRLAIAGIYQHQDPQQIACFVGAQEAIFCSLVSLLQPKDKVVAITPIFAPLIATAEEIGCQLQLISLDAKQQWQLDLDELEAAIKANCKLLVLNFPHNPTGAMISEQQLEHIIQLCAENDCWILSDEVFRGLEHDPHDRLPAVADRYAKAISIGVLSKAFALPALRVGWVSCQDQQLLTRMLQVKTAGSICGSRIDELIATKVITQHEKIWQENRRRLNKNFQSLASFMAQHNDLFDFAAPKAGCVCFPILKNQTADELSKQLIEDDRLMILANDLFLTELNGFRLSFGYQANLEYLDQLIK